MKKAALYARVSSDIQQKERTIESQIEELRKHISKAEDVLVKEYVDDGYSGAELDRPAMNQLRSDLRNSTFDAIYFLNADRIARDVTYQNIIIGEILKYRKQIIINGVDYIHNPENKFTLTVLGAVSELERAKIIERSMRGRMHRLNQGYLLGHGHNTFGYKYVRKTPEHPSYYLIDEREGKIVRYIFETYAKGDVGMNQITRHLEERGIKTRGGSTQWNVAQVKYILKNEVYVGIRYFHTRTLTKESNNPLYKPKYGKKVYRDRSEWIGIEVPAIVSKELFEKVKAKRDYNISRYRNPKRQQLLGNLVECAECGCRFFSYRRYYKKMMANGKLKIYHKAAYKCNTRNRQPMHSEKSGFKRCHNPEIAVKILDECVTEMIEENLFNKESLRLWMNFLQKKTKSNQDRMEKRLTSLSKKIADIEHRRQRILDLYASGEITREVYTGKSRELDTESNELKLQKIELIKQIPLLHKKEVVEVSLAQYCRIVREQYKLCSDFSTKRQFLLQHIEKVVVATSKVQLYGYVPVQLKAYENPELPVEASKIRFCIEKDLDRNKLLAKLKAREECEEETNGTQITWAEHDKLILN